MTAAGHSKGSIDRGGHLVPSHAPKALASQSTSSQQHSSMDSAIVFLVMFGDSPHSQPFLVRRAPKPLLPCAPLPPVSVNVSLDTDMESEMSYPNDGSWFGPGRRSWSASAAPGNASWSASAAPGKASASPGAHLGVPQRRPRNPRAEARVHGALPPILKVLRLPRRPRTTAGARDLSRLRPCPRSPARSPCPRSPARKPRR